MNNNIALWLAIVFAVVQLSSSFEAPYVKSEDVAPYKVIRKTQKYEIRSYLPSKWVCLDHTGPKFTKRHQGVSFLALFDYVSGANLPGVNISMAGPTTVRSLVSEETPGQILFQMCLYLPVLHQENPPQPLEDDLYIQHRGKLTVAAKKFDHYMMKENEWETQMAMLKSDLMAANEPGMDFNDYYGAAFDDPFDINGRPNEVWVVKKE